MVDARNFPFTLYTVGPTSKFKKRIGSFPIEKMRPDWSEWRPLSDLMHEGHLYPSSYACPICGKQMLKTVLKPGHELCLGIDDEDGRSLVAVRLFYCHDCSWIFTSYPKESLGYENFYALGLQPQSYSENFFANMISPFTTTDGRMDDNEFIRVHN